MEMYGSLFVDDLIDSTAKHTDTRRADYLSHYFQSFETIMFAARGKVIAS